MNNNKLEILVTAKDSASKVISGVGRSFGSLSNNAVAGSRAMLGAATAAAAGVAVFGKTSVDAYFGAAEASAKLATNILNVKGNTDKHVASLEALASKMQAYGVIEDDAIKAGMSQLATFNLQAGTIATLTPKIGDMVAQMKGHNATAEDMVGINNLVGKVMTGNVGALSRYGVTLSETQKKQIQNGTEAERAATLVEVLGQNYGEVNKRLRETPQGMLTGLKNDFGDLQEGVGELIVAAFMPLARIFRDWMQRVNEAGGFVEYFTKLIRDNKDKVIMLAGALTAVLLPAIISIVGPMLPAAAAIAALAAAGAFLAPKINDLANKFGGWGAILQKVKAWFESIKPTLISWGQTAIAILGQVGNFLKALWAAIVAGIQFLMPSLMALWNTISTNLIPTLIRLWNFISPVLIPILKVLAVIVGAVLVAAIWIAINVLNAIIKVITWVINVVISVVQKIVWFGSMVVQVITFVYNIWRTIWTGIFNVLKAILNGIIAYYRFWFNTIVAIIRAIPGIVSNIFRAAFNFVVSIWNGIGGFFSGIVGRIRGVLGGVTNAITAPFKAAFNFVKDLPGKIVGSIGNIGNLLRDKLGDFDIPGPLGKVRDVIPGFASGGFTGRGGTNEPAGIVHRGEYVIPKRFVNQSTGLPNAMGGGVHTEIHGNVILKDEKAVDSFFAHLERQGELARQGVAI